MPPNISFQIRQSHVANLQASQTLAIKLEDDLIATKKWKRDIQSVVSTSTTMDSSINSNVVIQKLSNEMISMKR